MAMGFPDKKAKKRREKTKGAELSLPPKEFLCIHVVFMF